jgi:uncharacterized membrane protein SpoIIM required for sporulation
MKVSELLEKRRENWRQLEQLLDGLKSRRLRVLGSEKICRFAELYRAACADLALADAYQLPPGTVGYLHDLVGRAHNQFYRSQRFHFRDWGSEIFERLPARLVRDRCLWLAMGLFWGVFFLAMMVAHASPEFCHHFFGGADGVEQIRDSFSQPLEGRDPRESSSMIGFYIQHNTSIGLQCFCYGLLLGVGGIFATVSNAAILGSIFGYMSTVPESVNFFHFVTAHGPFELTAIVLSAAAGMRLGFSLITTHGQARMAALRGTRKQVMPMMGLAIALFVMAGLIEAFISPSGLPYPVKAAVGLATAGLLLFYFLGLGLARRTPDAVG